MIEFFEILSDWHSALAGSPLKSRFFLEILVFGEDCSFFKGTSVDRQGETAENVFDIRDGFWVTKKRLQTVKVNGREEENL